MSKIVKISGGAVSLYLTADVKHLHDLARQHPHLTCSEIYATALRSALGENESMHPLEMMVDNQKREVEEIQSQLESARLRLEASEGRLPLELAKSDWMRNLLGSGGLIHLKALRTFLFFDATAWEAPIPKPKTGTQALASYKDLLSKYEQTKRGPVAGYSATTIVDLHPEHLKGDNMFHCCEVNQLECGTLSRIQAADNRMVSKHEKNTEGVNLCDDLQYRCNIHWNARIKKNNGQELNETATAYVSTPKLRPHWEEEELTAEQIAISDPKTSLNKASGYLSQEKSAMNNYRRKNVIDWAIGDWALNHPDEAALLIRLKTERATTAKDESGRNLPNWAGMPPPTAGSNNARRRQEVIYSMSADEKENYQKDLQSYQNLVKVRAEHISGLVREWADSGSEWPYERMEVWDDEEMVSEYQAIIQLESPYDATTNSLLNTIEFDLKNC